MVIQRIQSVFLLLAAILMVLVNFLVPVANEVCGDFSATYYLSDFMTLMLLNLIAAAILAVDIFLFKNLKLQMKVVRICVVLIIASALLEAWALLCTLPKEIEVTWVGTELMLVCALGFALAAYNGMKKDHKLLTSYDRLR